ncbi:UNC93-like protein MFSD11 [Diabrotica undecimpunctata]|uniref:UNC93-like protein MFSD11 n=1 Tax=Diabrotica undecimpunctata TaxID=50387 RepID=UPI003B63CB0C
MDKSLLNIVLLGLAFMLVFAAFQTMTNIQKTITDSIIKDKPSYKGDAYYSQAIIYVFFSLFNWTAPSVINMIGPKLSMFIGGTVYVLFMLQFLLPTDWGLYLCSAVLGIGAAMIWTGQGNYLTLNSTRKLITRNSGIFWALLQLSMLGGNTFVFFAFQGKDQIDKTTRIFVIITLSAIAVGGLVMLFLLPKAYKDDEDDVEEIHHAGPIEAFIGAVKLFITMKMFFLNFTFFYTGLELGFFSGIYSSCIGFTTQFKNRKALVGVSGILMGIGEVIGGAVFGIFGHKTVFWGRGPVVGTGLVLHALAFILIFLNLTNDSPFEDTHKSAIITSSSGLAVFCSFLLGLGDAIFNTQIFSILGSVYADNSAPAFAIFKFSQSVGAAVTFATAKLLGLHIQLLILLIMAIVGTVLFILVDRSSSSKDA